MLERGGLGESIDEKRAGITQIGGRTTPAHLARLLKRQRLGEPRVSWGQILSPSPAKKTEICPGQSGIDRLTLFEIESAMEIFQLSALID